MKSIYYPSVDAAMEDLEKVLPMLEGCPLPDAGKIRKHILGGGLRRSLEKMKSTDGSVLFSFTPEASAKLDERFG